MIQLYNVVKMSIKDIKILKKVELNRTLSDIPSDCEFRDLRKFS